MRYYKCVVTLKSKSNGNATFERQAANLKGCFDGARGILKNNPGMTLYGITITPGLTTNRNEGTK